MRSIVVAKSKVGLVLFGVLISAVFVAVIAVAPSYAQQTIVAATVCLPASTVMIVEPASDSIVTEAAVQLSGSVSQANQIEVYVDDIFDHTIPLGIAQTSFTGVVQMTQGTHTLKLVAVN